MIAEYPDEGIYSLEGLPQLAQFLVGHVLKIDVACGFAAFRQFSDLPLKTKFGQETEGIFNSFKIAFGKDPLCSQMVEFLPGIPPDDAGFEGHQGRARGNGEESILFEVNLSSVLASPLDADASEHGER